MHDKIKINTATSIIIVTKLTESEKAIKWEEACTHLKGIHSDTKFGRCQGIQLLIHRIIKNHIFNQLFLGACKCCLLITSQGRSRRIKIMLVNCTIQQFAIDIE